MSLICHRGRDGNLPLQLLDCIAVAIETLRYRGKLSCRRDSHRSLVDLSGAHCGFSARDGRFVAHADGFQLADKSTGSIIAYGR